MSTGADTKANTQELVRVAYLSDCSIELPLRPSAIAAPPSGPSWLCSRLRGVGSEMGGEPCQWALTQKQTLCVAVAHLSDLTAAAEGSSLLSTNAPGSPTPLFSRLSSVTLFSRKGTSEIPQ